MKLGNKIQFGVSAIVAGQKSATINAIQINTGGLKVTKDNPLYLGNNTTIIGIISCTLFLLIFNVL